LVKRNTKYKWTEVNQSKVRSANRTPSKVLQKLTIIGQFTKLTENVNYIL